MFKFLLILLAIWFGFMVIGFIFHALVWLAVIGIVLFLVTLVFGWSRSGADH